MATTDTTDHESKRPATNPDAVPGPKEASRTRGQALKRKVKEVPPVHTSGAGSRLDGTLHNQTTGSPTPKRVDHGDLMEVDSAEETRASEQAIPKTKATSKDKGEPNQRFRWSEETDWFTESERKRQHAKSRSEKRASKRREDRTADKREKANKQTSEFILPERPNGESGNFDFQLLFGDPSPRDPAEPGSQDVEMDNVVTNEDAEAIEGAMVNPPCSRCGNHEHAEVECPLDDAEAAKRKARTERKAKRKADKQAEREKIQGPAAGKSTPKKSKAAKQAHADGKGTDGKGAGAGNKPKARMYNKDLSDLLQAGTSVFAKLPKDKSKNPTEERAFEALFRAGIPKSSVQQCELQVGKGLYINLVDEAAAQAVRGRELEFRDKDNKPLCKAKIDAYRQSKSQIFWTQGIFGYPPTRVVEQVSKMMEDKGLEGRFVVMQKLAAGYPTSNFVVIFEKTLDSSFFTLQLAVQVEEEESGYEIRCTAHRVSDPCVANCGHAMGHVMCSNLRELPSEVGEGYPRFATARKAIDWLV